MNRRAFLALSAAPFVRVSATGNPGRVKLMSFNVRYINSGDVGWKTWTNRRDWVAEIIAREDPDVLGVQEAQRPIMDDLCQRLPGLEERGVGREDGKTLGEYAAIFFRKDRFKAIESGTFWLSDTPDVPNSRTWGNVVTRICTWVQIAPLAGGRPIHVYNVHLDHQSQLAREKGTDLILDHIAKLAPSGPVFLMGDFNSGEESPVVKKITSCPLQFVDTWRKLHPDVPPSKSGTMHAFTGAHDRAKIDYIFAPASQRLVSAEILRDERDGMFPSDHFPVTVTVEM